MEDYILDELIETLEKDIEACELHDSIFLLEAYAFEVLEAFRELKQHRSSIKLNS